MKMLKIVLAISVLGTAALAGRVVGERHGLLLFG